jgi:hypothetical protein
VSFFHATVNGSVAGAGVTRQHPFFVGAPGLTTPFGLQAAYSTGNTLSVFPIGTSLERYHGQNASIPGNTIDVELYEGGVTSGDSGTIPADDLFVAFDLTPITADAPATAGAIDGKAIELRVVQTGFSSALIQSAVKYVVSSDPRLSWHTMPWTVRLGSNAEEFSGIGGKDGVTTESPRQSPWARSGTFRQLMVIAIFQSGANDKTYTFALRKNGADVISVSTTNAAAGGANAQLLTDTSTQAAVAAGDFINWRVEMAGGFTAGRAVQFMAIVGFEDDN